MEAFIDLIQQEEKEQYGDSYATPSAANPAGPRSSAGFQTAESKPESLQTLSNITNDDDQSWTCPVCTLINPETFLCCDACTTERPQQTKSRTERTKTASTKPIRRPPSEPTGASRKRGRSAVDALVGLEKRTGKSPLGWNCHSCGSFMESQWWTCSLCGTMKQSS
jgi:rubrerythrin